jgi:hypothetical protein
MKRGIIAAALTGSVLLGVSLIPVDVSLENSIKNKPHYEKVELKSEAIIEKAKKGKRTINGITIDILNVEKIEGGIQVFARASRNGKPLGFGEDGTVEIERFRIFNPPVLVSDPKGKIEREVEDAGTGEIHVFRYREDPKAALEETLAHTISLVGKDGSNIVKGKVGNTTSTFYPDANPETTSVDGYVRHYSNIGFVNQVNDTTGTTANDSSTTLAGPQSTPDGGGFYNIERSATLFDTSTIPDGDAVSSAVVSLYGQFSGNTNNYSVRVVTFSPASNTALATADWNDFGSTSLANEITVASFSTSGYNDFTLTDLTQVSKTGVTKLGFRLTGEIAVSVPTGSNYTQPAAADIAGTSNDPKLVVVHAAAAVPARPKIINIE